MCATWMRFRTRGRARAGTAFTRAGTGFLHRLPIIKKVTSGSTSEIAEFVDTLYRGIITAGTRKARPIKVAEAAG